MGDEPGQGGLAALARSEQGGDRVNLKRTFDLADRIGSGNHGTTLKLEDLHANCRFSPERPLEMASKRGLEPHRWPCKLVHSFYEILFTLYRIVHGNQLDNASWIGLTNWN